MVSSLPKHTSDRTLALPLISRHEAAAPIRGSKHAGELKVLHVLRMMGPR